MIVALQIARNMAITLYALGVGLEFLSFLFPHSYAPVIVVVGGVLCVLSFALGINYFVFKDKLDKARKALVK